MKLSESLRRGIMETGAGGILNKFIGKKRRTTLFFEDILANYIKECEISGYSENMQNIGKRWSMLGFFALTPLPIRKLPVSLSFKIMKIVWTNLGILEDISSEVSNGVYRMNIRGDTITRIIGKNRFVVGGYIGLLSAVIGKEVECTQAVQTKNESDYTFRITEKDIPKQELMFKDKETYNRMNTLTSSVGVSLKDSVKKRIFQIKGNRIFFRGRSICNSESTLFHIFGTENIMMSKVNEISYEYFRSIIKEKTTSEKRLQTLKNILQIMGWGIINFVNDGPQIRLTIRKPPYGLQADDDNWNFILNVILGYIRIIDRKYKMVSSSYDGVLKAVYVKR